MCLYSFNIKANLNLSHGHQQCIYVQYIYSTVILIHALAKLLAVLVCTFEGVQRCIHSIKWLSAFKGIKTKKLIIRKNQVPSGNSPDQLPRLR